MRSPRIYKCAQLIFSEPTTYDCISALIIMYPKIGSYALGVIIIKFLNSQDLPDQPKRPFPPTDVANYWEILKAARDIKTSCRMYDGHLGWTQPGWSLIFFVLVSSLPSQGEPFSNWQSLLLVAQVETVVSVLSSKHWVEFRYGSSTVRRANILIFGR